MSLSVEPGTAIEARGVTKVFGSGDRAFRALDDVTVSIRDNEFFTLLGPSGCGKTTLLRLIAGFDHPTSGMIKLHGSDISHLPPYRRSVNTVFQSYALVAGWVCHPLGKRRLSRRTPTADLQLT